MQPGGALPGCPEPQGPVSTCIWRSRRPFHPERLYAALEPVLDAGIMRARGHLWLASRPLTLLSWESAGETLAIEPAGRWLHAADAATELHSALNEAVLTDPEMTAGEHAWAQLPDPFTPWLGPAPAEPGTRRTA
jgi:G3E family GTPase